MAVSFKGAHFPKDIILTGVRWYVAYPLSYRHVEELMEERGVAVDHATIQRWVVKYSPMLEEAFHRRKRPVWVSWRMDETYIKVKGEWKYLYRTVDKDGKTNECSPQQAAGYQNPKPETLKTAPSGYLGDEASYTSVRCLAS
jgi:transposase-like protein